MSEILTRERLATHVRRLQACRHCPRMHSPSVSGGPVVSRVILVGQAPGDKEPKLGRPFAWTAGKTLFNWFAEALGVNEELFRSSVYMAAVCRCFPGKDPNGGDRVPALEEIAECSNWLKSEFEILRPKLIIPVGKLAIAQFLEFEKLKDVIGSRFKISSEGNSFDVIPLPHPSGASTWHRMEPGKSLLRQALGLIARHPEIRLIKKKA
jgi:uracil-DNA glycosylase